VFTQRIQPVQLTGDLIALVVVGAVNAQGITPAVGAIKLESGVFGTA